MHAYHISYSNVDFYKSVFSLIIPFGVVAKYIFNALSTSHINEETFIINLYSSKIIGSNILSALKITDNLD